MSIRSPSVQKTCSRPSVLTNRVVAFGGPLACQWAKAPGPRIAFSRPQKHFQDSVRGKRKYNNNSLVITEGLNKNGRCLMSMVYMSKNLQEFYWLNSNNLKADM